MSRQSGVSGVLLEAAREISEQVEASGLPAEQLDLLGLPPSSAARLSDDRRIVNSVNSGAGVEGKKPAHRPAGSQNLLTRDVKRIIMATLGDPALARLRPFFHATEEELARRWKMEIGEVVKLRDKVLADLQDLFHAKAVPVDDQGKPLPQFALQLTANGPVAIAVQPGAPVPPWLTDKEIAGNIAKSEQNQALTLDDAPQSHEQSHTGEAK